MDRKEFLSLPGLSTAFIAMALCLGGCAKNVGSGTTAPTNIDFTLDLSQGANAALQQRRIYL